MKNDDMNKYSCDKKKGNRQSLRIPLFRFDRKTFIIISILLGYTFVQREIYSDNRKEFLCLSSINF